jgi:hypothetical protein
MAMCLRDMVLHLIVDPPHRRHIFMPAVLCPGASQSGDARGHQGLAVSMGPGRFNREPGQQGRGIALMSTARSPAEIQEDLQHAEDDLAQARETARGLRRRIGERRETTRPIPRNGPP